MTTMLRLAAMALVALLLHAPLAPAHAEWWSTGGTSDCNTGGKNFGSDYEAASRDSIMNLHCVSGGGEMPQMFYDTHGNPSTFASCTKNPIDGALPHYLCGDGVQVGCGTGQISTPDGCKDNTGNNSDPCSKSSSGQAAQGDPICLDTGNVQEAVTDFSTAGPRALTSTRYYNSNTGYNGAYQRSATVGSFFGRFGFGWRSEYDSYIAANGAPGAGATSLNLVRANGETVHFLKSGGAWYVAYWDPSSLNWSSSSDPRHDANITLVEDTANSHWLVTDSDDTVETYDSANPGVVFFEGKLLTRKTRDGYTLTFSYDTNGNNTAIDDTFGRHVGFTYGAGGFVDSFTDTNNTVTHYTYVNRACLTPPCPADPPPTDPAMWALKTVTYPDATALTYLYEDATPQNRFSLTGITDENGVRYATWAYDGQERATYNTLAGGADATTISYDDANNKRTVTNALGKQIVYELEQFQGQPRIKNVKGLASANTPASTVGYLYDSNGFIQKITSAEGRVTTFTHSGLGQETSRTDGFGTPEARTVSMTWDTTYNQPKKLIEPNLTIDLSYTAGKLMVLTETDTTTQSVPYSTNGQTRSWTFGYYPIGLLHTIDGPLAGTADTTTFAYNANGFLSSVADTLGHTTTITQWNGFGQPLSSTDPNGVVTNYTYDARDRIKTVTINPGANQALYSVAYDAAGQVQSITQPDGSSLAYGYDTAHRLRMITDNQNRRVTYALDALGNVTEIKTAASVSPSPTILFRQTATFDELGRMLKNIGAASQTTQYGYDKDDNLVSAVDPRSKLYNYAFDALNRLYQQTDPDLYKITLGINGKDDLVSATDPRTLVTGFVRDGFGDAIQVASPDSGTTVLWYDANGTLTKQVDARGVQTNYVFDSERRIVSRKIQGTAAENVTYVYDVQNAGTWGIGLLRRINDPSGSTTFNYDPLGHVSKEAHVVQGNTYNVSFANDPAGNVGQITYPSGRLVNYARDTMGHISSITTRQNAMSAPQTVASSASYRPFGPLTGLTFGNGLVLAASYDQDYQLTDIDTAVGATVVQDLTLGYDPSGNIQSIADNQTGSRSQTLGYDNLNRLNAATGAYGSQAYLYDGSGNRTQRTVNSVTDVYTTSPTSNRISSIATGANTRSFSYLATGQVSGDTRNPSNAYVYNYNNIGRLSSATLNGGTVGTYLYNGLEQRVVKTAGGATTHYVFDRLGHLIAEADGATGTVQREYIWLDDLPVAFVDETGAGPAVYYIHTNQIGAPQKITNGSASVVWDGVFDPFAVPNSVTGAVTNNLRLPGQYAGAETGLNQNWNRDYDPTLGRYVETDPIGLLGGINVYDYVEGNPVTRSDPAGKQGLLGAALGAAFSFSLQFGANLWSTNGDVGKAMRCVNWTSVAVAGFSGLFFPGFFKSGIGMLELRGAGLSTEAAYGPYIDGLALRGAGHMLLSPRRIGSDCECRGVGLGGMAQTALGG